LINRAGWVYVSGMKNPRAKHGPAGDEFADAASLMILLVCEDAACARQATNMMGRVNELLPLDTRAQAFIREFDSFPPLEAGSAGEARPDIVVVAAHGNRRLPAAVKRWLGRWAKGGRGLTCALASALDRRHGHSAEALQIREYLRQLAAGAGIDWLEAGGADAGDDERFRRDLKQQASQVSSTLDEIVRTRRPPARPGTII
jgi:hypothetical protein